MTDRIQVVAIAGSLLLLAIVLELVRRRRLSDEYALAWIGFGLVLLGASVFRGALDRCALWLGIHYPPALLLLALVALVFLAALNFSVIVSRQRRQIERLIEDVAMLQAELRELERGEHTLPGEDQRTS